MPLFTQPSRRSDSPAVRPRSGRASTLIQQPVTSRSRTSGSRKLHDAMALPCISSRTQTTRAPSMSLGSSDGHTGMPAAELSNVQMWYDERGLGDPLVALHPGGAGVDSRALTPQLEVLAEHFRVYAPEQRGHGHTPDAGGPITFELMAQDTITFIETVIGTPVCLLGCSD